MKWDDSLSIGCERVDNQHKELVSLVDHLESSLQRGITIDQQLTALRFIVNYTRHHFSAEEDLMKNIEFPELIDHKKLHNELIDQVTKILLDLKGGAKLDAQVLVVFLVDWVKKHVLEEDQKIGKYILLRKLQVDPDSRTACRLAFIDRLNERIAKLKKLFADKTLDIEDYREQKLLVFIDFLKDCGLKNLRDSLNDLAQYVVKDVITEKEKTAILLEYFKSQGLEKAVSSITQLETQLLYLRLLFEFDLISDDVFNLSKAEILSAI